MAKSKKSVKCTCCKQHTPTPKIFVPASSGLKIHEYTPSSDWVDTAFALTALAISLIGFGYIVWRFF